MSAGDNFDTTQPGLEGYKTKRHAGHGPIAQTYMSGKEYNPQGGQSDNNLGHPCNAGCGCKEICDPNLTAMGETGCLLPPELTIRVAQAGSRQGARGEFAKVDGKDFKTYHLKYENGTWRGRRCCKTGKDSAGKLIDYCDPCSITTHADGTKSDCIYSGREGSTREAPMGTPKGNIADRSRGMASRTNETFMGEMDGNPNQPTSAPHAPDPTAGAKDWIPQPRIGGGTDCLEDGSIVPYTSPYCHVEWGGSGFFYEEDDGIGETECNNGGALMKSVSGDAFTPDTSDAAHIGRCYCIANCEAATDVGKSMDEVLDLDTKGRCEHPKDAKYGTPIDDHIEKYGKTKWFPAQCVQYIAGEKDGWRHAKNCEGVVPPHCQDSNGAYLKKENGKPKYPDERSCLKQNSTWITTAPEHCEDGDGQTTNAATVGECEKDNNKWEDSERVFDEIIIDKFGCISQGYCLTSGGSEVDVGDKQACTEAGATNTWAYNTWTSNWIRSEPFNNCCGGQFVGQNSSSHQPNLSRGGRMGGVSTRPGGQTDNICITPYDEAILIDPGRTAAQINLPCIASQGVGPPSSTGAGRGEGSFILILKGCDFNNDCTTLSDPDRGGRLTILYIPLDQILNCSNLDLNTSEIKADYNDNVAIKASYSFEFANPMLEHYPLDATAVSPYLEPGFERFTTDEGPIYIYHESGQDHHIRPPKDHDLTKLNMQYGPFKATEDKQNYHKTYSQAAGDALGYTICACVGGCFEVNEIAASDPNGTITPVDFWTKAECEAAGASANKQYEWHTGCPQQFDAKNPVFESCPVESAAKWFDRDIVDPGTSKPVDWYNVSQKMLKICKKRRAKVDKELRSRIKNCPTYPETKGCGDYIGRILYKHKCGYTTSYCQYHGGVDSNILKEPQIVRSPSVWGSNNLDYWANTGLYPQTKTSGDVGTATIFQPSHVAETCFGNEYSGNIEYASNTRPIVIKTTNHGLENDDAVTIGGVLGNFAANTLTQAQLDEIHWDFKKSKKCKGEHCHKTVNPPAKCVTGTFDTTHHDDGPKALQMWIIHVIDKDHFALFDCNGDPSDGRVQYGPSVWNKKKKKFEAKEGFGREEPCPPVCADALPTQPELTKDQNVPNWEVCPYTGFWESPSASDPSQLFGKTLGWRPGGFGFFKIDEKTAVAQDWYVDIAQTEVCPVCCDHYMPLELVATVKDPGTLLLDAQCGFDCEGDLHPEVMTGQIGPDGWPGKIGGGNCCNCQYGCQAKSSTPQCQPNENGASRATCAALDTQPSCQDNKEGVDNGPGCHWTNSDGAEMVCGCWKCSDRTRSGDKPVCRSGYNDGFKKARKGLKCGDDPNDVCCSCDCCPGDARTEGACNKTYPTLSDWAACGKKCGEPGYPTSLGKLECEKKPVYGCVPNPMNPGGDPSVCLGQGTEPLCNGVSGGACMWQISRYQDMFDPCLGFPNNRPHSCEGSFMCVDAAPNSEGQSCTAIPPSEGGAYFNNDAECWGIDMDGGQGKQCDDCDKAIVTGCDKFEYKERPKSCPGFPDAGLDIPLKWDGIKWLSEWIPMGKVGTKQCHTFADTPPLGKGRTGPPFAIGPSNFCGDCNGRHFEHFRDADGNPPAGIGSPPEDKFWMQLVMGCGNAIEMGGQGLPTVDSYNETILNMRMNIFACKLPETTGRAPCPSPLGGCDIPGYNCGPAPPCLGCCSFTGDCEVANMYGMDPAACLNLQGGQIKGNIEGTEVNGQPWSVRTFRKEPEVFEIYYVDMDNDAGSRGYDLLVGRQIGGRACGWYAERQVQRGGKTVTLPADRVSIGLADRIPAETGGKYFGSNLGGFSVADADNTGTGSILPSSTDRLSASSAYPESTYLVEDVVKPEWIPVDWGYQKDWSGSAVFCHKVPDITSEGNAYVEVCSTQPYAEPSRRIESIQPKDVLDNVDPKTGYGKIKKDGTANYPQWVEIKVKDATKLTSHNRALDRHLYRGTSRQEPWPYGDAPWPVPHQSEFNVPQDSVYQIGANFEGPLNNLFRVGIKPSKAIQSFEGYFIADEPLLMPVATEDGSELFELIDPFDGVGGASSGQSRLHMNDIEKVEEVDATYNGETVKHIRVTTQHDHDLTPGEKIWLDEVEANQGACKIHPPACIKDGNDITSSYPTKAKCHTCLLPNGDDVTEEFPSKAQCENMHTTLGTKWTGVWTSGMIQRRKLQPDLTIKVTEDYCEHKDFGICRTKIGALGLEIRSNPDEPDKKIGVISDSKGDETNAITDKAVCLAITKDEDDNNLSPVWTGPGEWVDSGISVKGCVSEEGGEEQEDFEDLAGRDPCELCYVRCRYNNMFWNGEGSCEPRNCCGREDYCPSAAANGTWVVDNVTSNSFTIHDESYIDPESNDAIGALDEYDPSASVDPFTTKNNATKWNKEVPGHSMGHEVGIGPPAGPFGEFYKEKDPDVDLGLGVWTRHGGLFRIAVGSHEGTPWDGMDCRQANTAGPTDLDFQFVTIPEVCCNIHDPVGDDACSGKGWPGYGPTSQLSTNLDGVAFVVNVTEGT